MQTRFLYPEGTLPPPDARLINPYSPDFEPLPTPIDDRGLVEIDALIALVKSTVDPSYRWPSEANVHHFLWPEAAYFDAQLPENPLHRLRLFRELTIHKGYIPRVFENWLHLVTAPPPIPDPEVRAYRIQAWHVARDLFLMARKTINTERDIDKRYRAISAKPETLKQDFAGEDRISDEILLETWTRNFKGYEMQLARQRAIPPEFWVVDMEGPPHEIATALGQFVIPKALRLGSRFAYS